MQTSAKFGFLFYFPSNRTRNEHGVGELEAEERRARQGSSTSKERAGVQDTQEARRI